MFRQQEAMRVDQASGLNFFFNQPQNVWSRNQPQVQYL